MTSRGKQTLHEVYMLLQHCPPPPTPSFKTRVCLTPVRSKDVGTVYKVTTRGKLRLIFSELCVCVWGWGAAVSSNSLPAHVGKQIFFLPGPTVLSETTRRIIVSGQKVRGTSTTPAVGSVSVCPSRSAVCVQPRSKLLYF